MKAGDYLEVTWMDAAGYVNEPLSKAIPAKAINTGRLVRKTKHYIVLCTGEYPELGNDPCGDWTVIPTGWIVKWKLIKKA